MNNSEFEKELKCKMDELSSSVDCFDKIAKRAFPQENSDYSDCEYTVTDVENITGRRSRFRLVTAAAAAVVAVGVFALPAGLGSLNNVFSDKTEKSDIKAYRSLIAEISEETQKDCYTYFDCSLADYYNNDLLISPLYECPFEYKDDESIKVRIFTKMCGEIPTNQIYAVQYEGRYEDGNILAAADSKAKFSDEELSQYSEITDISNPLPESAVFEKAENEFFADSAEGYNFSAASFEYDCIYKLEDNIFELASGILYFSDNRLSVDRYEYDILSYYTENNSEKSFETDVFAEGWNNAYYNNGSSAFEDKETGKGLFAVTELFNESDTLYTSNRMAYAEPFETFDIMSEIGLTFTIKTDVPLCTVPAPLCGENFRMYMPAEYTGTPILNLTNSKGDIENSQFAPQTYFFYPNTLNSGEASESEDNREITAQTTVQSD